MISSWMTRTSAVSQQQPPRQAATTLFRQRSHTTTTTSTTTTSAIHYGRSTTRFKTVFTSRFWLCSVPCIILFCAFIFVLGHVLFFRHFLLAPPQQQQQQQQHEAKNPIQKGNERNNPTTCDFRRYPPHRYYHLNDPLSNQPDFLKSFPQTEYIYGEWPIVLPISSSTGSSSSSNKVGGGGGGGTRQNQEKDTVAETVVTQHKVCVNQKAWSTRHDPTKELPFADGTNPSILSVQRLRDANANNNENDENNIWNTPPLSDAVWLVTVCMTQSQCKWKDSEQEVQDYKLSTLDTPDTIRTVLLILNASMETMAQATIYLERDFASWGKHKVTPSSYDTDTDSNAAAAGGGNANTPKLIFALDDARLFLHNGKELWISYREGKGFGYDAQVLNRVHITWNAENMAQPLSVTIKASETTTFCCGRNMALMQDVTNPDVLLSVTWVDPITVIQVDTTPDPQGRLQKAKTLRQIPLRNRRRRLASEQHPQQLNPQRQLRNDTTLWHDFANATFIFSSPQQRRRRLQQHAQQSQHKSHIHGTNAFMVHLADSKEFLGMGHFHRPNDRNPNPYARFGHHYTHALFTMTSQPPYRLTALSPEFVLPSKYPPTSTTTTTTTANADAEVIQFASGLEMDPHDPTRLVIAYGINDCEAAIVKVDMVTVRNLLRPVPAGKQVVDFMQPLKV